MLPNYTDFHEPFWFALLALLPVLVWLFWKRFRHQYPILLLAQAPGSNKSILSNLLTPPVILFSLRIASIFFLLIGLADLRSAKVTKHQTPAEGIDIVLALDISGSMLIEDIKPNRLEALKDVLTKFIAGRDQDRFGLVLYAGESINWCPLTQDYGFLLSKLNNMNDEVLADGTAIGLGLTSAVNALRHSDSKSKVVILLTDGENNTGYVHPFTAADIAKKHQVKLYTIGIGTNGLAPLPLTDMNGKKIYHYVQVKIDEPMLTKMAEATGGKYYRAVDAAALKFIYTDIDKLEKTQTGIRTEVVYEPAYQLFLIIAMGLFMMEMLLKFTFYRSLA